MTTRNGATQDGGRPTEGRADGAPVEVEDDRLVGLTHDIDDDSRERGMARRLAGTVPGNRRLIRQDLPLDHEAELVRGLNYRLSYWPEAVTFFHGERVPINRNELEHLAATAIDTVTYTDLGPDGLGRVKRSVAKFRFFDRRTGEEVPLDVPADQHVANRATDPFEAARHRRMATGMAKTRA